MGRLPVLHRNRCPVCKKPMRLCCNNPGCLVLQCDEDKLLWNPVTQRAAAIRDPGSAVGEARHDQRSAVRRDEKEKR